eukprot:3402387-Amphidinium_carterae.1
MESNPFGHARGVSSNDCSTFGALDYGGSRSAGNSQRPGNFARTFGRHERCYIWNGPQQYRTSSFLLQNPGLSDGTDDHDGIHVPLCAT